MCFERKPGRSENYEQISALQPDPAARRTIRIITSNLSAATRTARFLLGHCLRSPVLCILRRITAPGNRPAGGEDIGLTAFFLRAPLQFNSSKLPTRLRTAAKTDRIEPAPRH